MRRAHVVRRRRIRVAAVARDGAAVGEHAARQVRARQRQEARDGVEPSVVLALPALRDAADEPDGVRVPRLAQDLLGRPLLDQRAGVQDAHAIAHAGDHAEVVRDEEHRGRELLPQGVDEVEHLGLHRRVERGRRLVEHQQRRVGGERHRDHDALLHAARELVGVAVHDPGRVGDLDLAQHRLGALAGRARLRAAQLEDLRHLPADADRRVQRPARVLVDHRDGVQPQPAQLLLAQREHVAATDADAAAAHAAVGGQVADDRHGHRRLAAARLADEAVRAAVGNRERDAAEHLAIDAAHPVDDVEVVHLERRRVGQRRRVDDRLGLLGHASCTCRRPSEIRLMETTSDATAIAGNSDSHQ